MVSPYHLKQYNNRWFLVAKRKDFDKMSNYAIDRIEGIKETTRTFEPLDNDFDFEEFFSDVVGVSVVEGALWKCHFARYRPGVELHYNKAAA